MRGFTLAPKGDNGSTTDNGTLSFEAPPVAPTLGSQALKFTSTTGGPVVLYLPLPSGYHPVNGPRPLLGEVTKASYGSLIHTQPQNALDIGFQFEVYKANVGTASGYTTVVFEPYHSGADETKDVWHRHAVDIGKVWSTRALPSGDCTQAVPCPFRVFREQNPYAEVDHRQAEDRPELRPGLGRVRGLPRRSELRLRACHPLRLRRLVRRGGHAGARTCQRPGEPALRLT